MAGWSETEQERRDLAEYVETLTEQEWDSVVPNSTAPDRALRVREHVAHVIQGATESTTSAVVGVARCRFDYNAYYDREAREAGAQDRSALIAQLRAAVTAQQRLLGLPGPKPMAMLAETFDHHQHLRHHFDSPREIPAARMVMVLDVAKTAGFPLGIKKRISGIRLCATDIDWQWGNGPEIRGPGEAIFFAMLKKRMLLDKLDGDGVAVLTARF